jgi:hypothetical protein
MDNGDNDDIPDDLVSLLWLVTSRKKLSVHESKELVISEALGKMD